MCRNSVLLLVSVPLALGCLVRAQTKRVETAPSTVTVAYFSRTSSYDYRVVSDGPKQYLEMRETGKQKWKRVEDVTCTNGPGRHESESFDYAYVCE
jgi:hypothetical protein